MTKTSLKKFTSIALAVLMILSTFMVGAITASADGTSTVYLKPNANWNKDGARFAVYVFNSTGNAWASMEADSVDGVYRADIPSGSWSSIIFCRMNGATTENNWDNKWNQTDDLTISGNEGKGYVVADGTWDKGGGSWVSYSDLGGSTPTNPTSPSGGGTLITDKFAIVVYDTVTEANTEFYIEGGVVEHEFDNNSYIFIRKYQGGVQYCLGSSADVFSNPATFFEYGTPKADTFFPKMSIGSGTHTIKLYQNPSDSDGIDLYIDREPESTPTDPTDPTDPTTQAPTEEPTTAAPTGEPTTAAPTTEAPTTAPVIDTLNAEVKLNGTTVKTIPVKGTTVTVTYNLKSDKLITDGDIALSYDSACLQLASVSAPAITSGSVEYNHTNPYLLNFTGVNSATKSGIYDFKTEKAFIIAAFNVVAGSKGNAIVNLKINDLDALENEVTTTYFSNGSATSDGSAVVASLSDPKVEASDGPTIPTTQAPTTQAPTTPEPTTPEPTTAAPTTQAPTTEAPTTAEPTTQAPTTQAPTTPEPTTAAPTTVAPTTAEPTTQAPTTQPATKAPSLTFTKKSAMAGSRFTLGVKNKGSNKVTFTTSNKKIATVTSKGVITTLQKGSATIKVKVGTKTLSCKITVTNNPVLKRARTYLNSKKTYKIKKGKTLVFKLYRRASTIKNVYKSTNKKIAKITSKAAADKIVVKGYKVGKATITIKINGVKTYKMKVKVVK